MFSFKKAKYRLKKRKEAVLSAFLALLCYDYQLPSITMEMAHKQTLHKDRLGYNDIQDQHLQHYLIIIYYYYQYIIRDLFCQEIC